MDDRIAFSLIEGNILQKIKDMQETARLAEHKTINIDRIDQLTPDLGMIPNGETRHGNGVPPGQGFTGTRAAWPPMTYNAEQWTIVGVLLDVLQVGFNALTGKLLAGGGSVILDATGVHVFDGATEVIRLGNLNGFLTYIADTFGIAIGDLLNFLTYTPAEGLRIRGDFEQFPNLPMGLNRWMHSVLGDIDGVNDLFIIPEKIVSGTLSVTVNGIWCYPGDVSEKNVAGADNYITIIPYRGITALGDDIWVTYVQKSDNAVIHEKPIVTLVGFVTVLETTTEFKGGTAEVFVNGITLDLGLDFYEGYITGYTITEDTTGNNFLNGNSAFSMMHPTFFVPEVGDNIRVCYQTIPDTNWVYNEYPAEAINGINTVFTTASNFVSTDIYVFLNGIWQAQDLLGLEDFVVTGANEITFVVAPLTDDKIWFIYKKA